MGDGNLLPVLRNLAEEFLVVKSVMQRGTRNRYEEKKMSEQANSSNGNRQRTTLVRQGTSQAVYGLGFIGALVYYISHAATFAAGLLGVLKAIIWPALLIYKVLELLKM